MVFHRFGNKKKDKHTHGHAHIAKSLAWRQAFKTILKEDLQKLEICHPFKIVVCKI